VLLASCTALRTHDIADAFAADAALVVDRVPTKADPDPARAANAPGVMLGTERAAREFLAGRRTAAPPPAWTPPATEAYARALLACALLAQGRVIEGRDALRWIDDGGVVHQIRPRLEADLTRENVVVSCAVHAASLCRSIEARAAAERFLEGRLDAEAFARDYGSFAGLAIAEPGSPEHENVLKLAAKGLGACSPGAAEPTEAARAARATLLRTLAEQVYNDAASLLARLPSAPLAPPAAEEVWLAKVAVRGATVYRYLIPDMLPDPLSADQKAWQREQAFPLFKRARSIAGYFLAKGARAEVEATRIGRTPEEVLYDRLLSAQIEVLAWIDTR
jgi:hypothetical protein